MSDIDVKLKINPGKESDKMELKMDITVHKKIEIMKKLNLVGWPYSI